MIAACVRVLLAALLLAGCAHVVQTEPALPFPSPPEILFRVAPPGDLCLSPADANLLEKWLKKLDAFQAARLRLLRTH